MAGKIGGMREVGGEAIQKGMTEFFDSTKEPAVASCFNRGSICVDCPS